MISGAALDTASRMASLPAPMKNRVATQIRFERCDSESMCGS